VSRVSIAAAYVAARWRAATLHGARLQAWQETRAASLIEFVRQRSPYYRDLWAAQPASDWRRFPTVDKAAMMREFDRFTTVGVSRDAAMRVALDAEQRRDFSAQINGCTVGLSSGTSGHRGLFLVSPGEQARWAGTILARAIPDLRPRYRVAFFLRANSRLYEQTSAMVQFRFFDLMSPLQGMIAELNAMRPQLIVGPPSLLGMLADARQRGELRAAPSRLISVAEVIEPQDRVYLENSFQAPVGEVYQCTEGLVAVACRSGSLHVQEDIMVMQTEAVTDADPTRVTPVLTDLWRRTQPIIRYRLGDVLRLNSTPCACGSSWQRIDAIEGRQDDLCWFRDTNGALRIVFPDAIRRMILLADDGIAQYRAEQDAPGTLAVQIEILPGHAFAPIADRIRASVADALRAYDCHATSVRVDEGLSQPAAGVKRRRVVCTWRRGTAERTATAPS
jgi:putative adenylate-forming enzyme